jgi:hypothetical protein
MEDMSMKDMSMEDMTNTRFVVQKKPWTSVGKYARRGRTNSKEKRDASSSSGSVKIELSAGQLVSSSLLMMKKEGLR